MSAILRSCLVLPLTLLTLILGRISPGLLAQTPSASATAQSAAPQFDSTSLSALTWRNIGPFRGGRVVAVTGVPQQPRTFLIAGTQWGQI